MSGVEKLLTVGGIMMAVTVILFLLVNMMFIVHSLGRFIVANGTYTPVTELTLGFGPAVMALKKGETLYKICLVPLGMGMELGDDNKDRSQVLVAVGGITSIIFFTSVLYAVIFSIGGLQVNIGNGITTTVMPNIFQSLVEGYAQTVFMVVHFIGVIFNIPYYGELQPGVFRWAVLPGHNSGLLEVACFAAFFSSTYMVYNMLPVYGSDAKEVVYIAFKHLVGNNNIALRISTVLGGVCIAIFIYNLAKCML